MPDPPCTRAAARAVIFDMDGLIVDSERTYRAAMQETAAALGHPMSDALYAACTGTTLGEGERIIAEALGSAFPLAAFQQRWPARWHEIVAREGMPRKPGVGDLLAALRAREVPVALATSSSDAWVDATLAAAALEGRFPVRITADCVANGKPAPDLFLAAASALGVDPAACVVLEDSAAGVAAGAAAGMHVIMVPDLEPASAGSRRLAAEVCGSLIAAQPAVLARLGLA